MTQSEALDILKLGYNVFLTGPAGSGKTHLLNKYINFLKDNYVDVPDTFKQQCDLIKGDAINGTNDTQNCYNVTATTKKINQPITSWELYNGGIMTDGDYNWKWEGKRYVNQILDVQPVALGIPLVDWIWFNNSWSYKQQINLRV